MQLHGQRGGLQVVLRASGRAWCKQSSLQALLSCRHCSELQAGLAADIAHCRHCSKLQAGLVPAPLSTQGW